MTTVKISELPFASFASGSAKVPIVQDGVTYHCSASALSGTGGGGPPILAGNLRVQTVDDLLIETEVKLGGFSFDPSLHSYNTLYLEMVGILTATGSLTADFDLRLYDMGEPNSPQAGDLRASVSITFSGSIRRERFPLTASASPTSPGSSPDDATIYNSERIYEVRGYLTGNTGDEMNVDWAGIRGD